MKNSNILDIVNAAKTGPVSEMVCRVRYFGYKLKRSKVIEFRFIYSLEYSIMNVGSNFYAYICMLNIILMLVNFGPENLSRALVLVLYVHIDINCSKYDVYSDTKLK